jgi:hypothetical protein
MSPGCIKLGAREKQFLRELLVCVVVDAAVVVLVVVVAGDLIPFRYEPPVISN